MRILCTSQNCSAKVSGRKYTPVKGGMLSEDLPDEEAQRLLTIPGYVVWDGASSKTDEKKDETLVQEPVSASVPVVSQESAKAEVGAGANEGKPDEKLTEVKTDEKKEQKKDEGKGKGLAGFLKKDKTK